MTVERVAVRPRGLVEPPAAREWNATERPYPRDLTVPELIGRQVAKRPDAAAIVHGDHRVSYAALDARAQRWAAVLRSHGIGPESLVGVHLERSPELVAVLLGVMKTGGAYLPLDVTHPRERVEFVIDDAGATALVTADATLAVPAGVRLIRPDATAGGRPDGVAGAARLRGLAAGSSLAFVLSTSGSTGRPKGVAVTHANAVDLLYWADEAFGEDLNRVLAGTSICFDCHILEIWAPLSWGGAVVLAQSPMDVVAHLDGTRVTLIHTVPSIVDELLRTNRLPDTVRSAMIGGETLLPGLVDRVYDRSSIERVLNLYGPTECTSYATMAVVARGTVDAPPIGRAVANTRLYLLDPDGEPVPIGEPGEVFVAGEGVTRGYLNRPGLTAERFLPEPFSGRSGQRMYRTGDLARFDHDGQLWFVRRIDDQVKVHGVRVEPGEVERALLTHPGVLDAAVVGVDGTLAAFVVPAGQLRADEVRSHLRERLPRPFVPEIVEFLDRLPRTVNGKIDRRALPALLPEAAPAPSCQPTAADPAALDEESVLAAMWAEAIGADAVDVHADVFGLGAHSLSAFRVAAQVSARLGDGEDVDVRLMFDRPTIAEQAAELRRRFGSRLLRRPPDAAQPQPRGRLTATPAAPSRREPAQPSPDGREPAQPSPDGREPAQPPPEGRELSLTQRHLVARADASPDDPSLTMPLFVRLLGTLRVNALRRALATVVARHELLRSVVGDGRMVADPGERPVPLADLTGLDPSAREVVANQVADGILGRRWPVREEPPMRMALLRISDQEHVLLIALHALAGDSWSIETLSHQLMVAYDANLHGRPAAELADPAQYHDWAAAQLRRLRSTAGQGQRRYWTERLAALPVLRLPGDARREPRAAAPGRCSFGVPATPQRIMDAIGRDEGVTQFMVLFTAFAVAVQRWTGQDDFTVGCPTAGRETPDLAQLIGPCTDVLTLRADLSGDPTFREAVRRVRDLALRAYANRDVPFVELAAEHPHDPSRHPLYQVSIEYHQRPSLLDAGARALLFDRVCLGDLRIFRLRESLAITSLDAELTLYERDDDLEGVLVCRGDVLTAEQVVRFAKDFRAAVDRGLAAPDTRCSAFPLSGG